MSDFLSYDFNIVDIVSFLLGAFLGAYLKKKGENVATKEDFEQLLTQLKQTTRETESIKMEISRGGWMNQQQWFLREKYYTGLLEGLYGLKESLESLDEWYIEPGSEYRDAEYNKNDVFQGHIKNAQTAFNKIKALHGPAEIVISPVSAKALTEFYSEYWSAGEFSVCHVEWIRLSLASVRKTHEIVLSEAQTQLM